MTHYPRFRWRNSEGRLFIDDALCMRFYMKRPHREIASAGLRAIEILRERIRPFQLDWYDTLEGQLSPLDDSIWERLRQKVLGPDDSGCIRLEDDPWKGLGEFEVEYSGLALPYPWPQRKDEVSGLYVRLPTAFLEERGPKWVRDLSLEVVEELPLNSGYVDFSFHPSEDAAQLCTTVRTRYPGVHLDSYRQEHRINTWVDGVHWLNFLGQPVLGQLGGAAGLRARLPPGIDVLELSGDRVLLTLGDAPDPGDVEAGHTLPLHRALARVLEPHLYHRARPLGEMTREEQLRWERRFLD